MGNNTKSNIAIWKIDESFLIGQSAEQFTSRLKKDANNGLPESSPYLLKELPLDNDKTQNLDVKFLRLLHRKCDSKAWYDFMSPILSRDGTAHTELPTYFMSERVDLVLLVGLGDTELFCITAGSGHHLIGDYIDDMYAFDVARHMFIGEVSEARNRSITGQKFAESVSYRNNYRINSSEAFGKIWRQLHGPLDKEFIKSRPMLESMINLNRNPQADAKASFTLKKSLSIELVVTLMKELKAIARLEPSEDKKEAFRFLNMAHPVKSPELKLKLRNQLFDFIFKDIFSDERNCRDFDFCHPRNVQEFFSSDKHSFRIGHGKPFVFNLNEEAPPKSENVIEALRTLEGLPDDRQEFEKIFSQMRYTIRQEDDEWEPISAPLWQYFHGELEYEGTHYFLIDKTWYIAKLDFLEDLKQYFSETIDDNDTLRNSVPFNRYTPKGVKKRENTFNIEQAKAEKFWYGDMQYARYGKAEIELFDLLYCTDDTTYVIQVKEGFAGSMRDACSQIKMSAYAIHQDLKNNKKMLKAYYAKWQDKNSKGLSREEFLSLFNRKKRKVVL